MVPPEAVSGRLEELPLAANAQLTRGIGPLAVPLGLAAGGVGVLAIGVPAKAAVGVLAIGVPAKAAGRVVEDGEQVGWGGAPRVGSRALRRGPPSTEQKGSRTVDTR